MFAWATGRDSPCKSAHGIDDKLPIKITAIICSATAYSQSVTAQVTIPAGEILGVKRVGPREEFSRINMAGLIAGRDTVAHGTGAFEDSPRYAPKIDSHLQRRLGKNTVDNANGTQPKLGEPNDNIVFLNDVLSLSALVLSSRTRGNLCGLLDPKILAATHERALKLRFALAVAVDLVDQDVVESVPVVRVVRSRGFVLKSHWARGTQAQLVVVIVLVAVLARWMEQRARKQDGDPNSLGKAISLQAASPEMSEKM